MSRTYQALLGRGLDSNKAINIVKAGYSIQELTTCDANSLNSIGITKEDIDLIFDSTRPAIPELIVDKLLYKSRRTCCICRDREKSIIIHHIIEWNISKSHTEDNLVVLCLHDHGEAHTKRELTLNLTPDRIKIAKEKWEAEVVKNDLEILLENFKELQAIPIKLSKLKSKWFNFLQRLNMKIENSDSSLYDFKIQGKQSLVLKVYEINDIEELDNKNVLIKEFVEGSFFDNFIILGNKPFLSDKGFYADELNIQIGWVYSHGEEDWDHVMLKEDYDISNSIFYIENFLYPHTSYKNFLTADSFDSIDENWKES